MNRVTARKLGSWKITVALLVLIGVTGIIDFHSWYYWTSMALYVAHIVYAYVVDGSVSFARRQPSWRRTDSRKAEGDERG